MDADDRCAGPRPHPRWVYGALSGLIVLYVSGLLLAAGPSSDLIDDVYEVAYPALELGNINNDWGFFSPDPGPGDVPRYEVVDGDGNTHAFEWMEALDRWDPAFFRYTTLLVAVIDSPRTYGPGATAMLCRRHADLKPRKIVFTVAHQVDQSPEDILGGKTIMSEAEVERLYFLPCEDAEP